MSVIDEILDQTLDILSSLNFKTFVSLGKRSPFDVVAKSGGTIILIKILTNIDGLKEQQARTLKNLASRLRASAIVIGTRTKSGEMLDGVVYERYSLFAITPKTLEDALSGRMPERKFWKGKFLTKINQDDLYQLLDKSGVERIANILNVSKEAVYQYKTGKIRIEEDKARKLVDRFQVKLDSFNILNPPSPEAQRVSGYLTYLENLGFDVVPVFKRFDALAKARESLILAKKDHPAKSSLEYLKTTGLFLDSHPAIVSDAGKDSVDGIPIISESEIKSAKKARDVIKLVKEREEK